MRGFFLVLALVLGFLALRRAIAVIIWLARGSIRSRSILTGWQLTETQRAYQPTKYWTLIAYNALVQTPLVALMAAGLYGVASA